LQDDIQTLRRLLKENHTIAVVGLSANWYRPSYFAAKYLQEYGYRIIPVNPRYEEILGEKCYPTVDAIPEKIDVVDVFQHSDRVMPFAEAAIRVGARVLWLQLGVVNEQAAALAQTAGLDVIMNRCMKIEHSRLFGCINFVGVNRKLISAKRCQWLPY
jgi:predicted CoA-binding protein